MEGQHWLMLIAVLVVGYYVGRHYPLNLPVIG
jgi:hypothetical protein